MCDYLTPSLVAKYLSTPAQLDSSAPQGFVCFYNIAGSKPGGNDVAELQSIFSNVGPDVINKIYKSNLSGHSFKDDSSIGFTAWYVPNSKNGSVTLYFASQHTVLSISVMQPNVGLDVNLKAAENIAKVIQPQLP